MGILCTASANGQRVCVGLRMVYRGTVLCVRRSFCLLFCASRQRTVLRLAGVSSEGQQQTSRLGAVREG